jgi:hypothetical protein
LPIPPLPVPGLRISEAPEVACAPTPAFSATTTGGGTTIGTTGGGATTSVAFDFKLGGDAAPSGLRLGDGRDLTFSSGGGGGGGAASNTFNASLTAAGIVTTSPDSSA